MKKAPACVLLTVAMIMLLSGCVVVPLPWSTSPPKFTKEDASRVRVGMTGDEVKAAMQWSPDQTTLEHVWVFGAAQSHGRLLAVGAPGGGAGHPLYFSYFVFFVEFDSDGKVSATSIVDAGTEGDHDPICNPDGLCVKSWCEEKSPEGFVWKRSLSNHCSVVYRSSAGEQGN